MLLVALVIFVLAALLFILSVAFWLLGCKKWCRGNNSVTDTNLSRRTLPPSKSTLKRTQPVEIEESGHYVDFGEDLRASMAIGQSSSEHHKAGNENQNEGGAFVETFDGSRMPQTVAPPVPQTEAPPIPGRRNKAPGGDKTTKEAGKKVCSANASNTNKPDAGLKSSTSTDKRVAMCDEKDNKAKTADTDQTYEIMDEQCDVVQNDSKTKTNSKTVIVDTDQTYEIMNEKCDANDNKAKPVTAETDQTYETMDEQRDGTDNKVKTVAAKTDETYESVDGVKMRDSDQVSLGFSHEVDEAEDGVSVESSDAESETYVDLDAPVHTTDDDKGLHSQPGVSYEEQRAPVLPARRPLPP